VEFTAYEGEIMQEVALSFSLYSLTHIAAFAWHTNYTDTLI